MIGIDMNSSEYLFWGGVILMGTAAVMAVLLTGVFFHTGRKLKKKLEQEYGKPEE